MTMTTARRPRAAAATRFVTVLAASAAFAVLATAPAIAASAAPSHSNGAATATAAREPRIAQLWASAWNSGDAARLAALYTDGARYTDHAFGATFSGRDGVAQWSEITAASIEQARVEVRTASRSGQQITVQWVFSGRIVGAPAAFSVPAVTVLGMRGNKISTNDDYYDLAELLRQSGF